jgi:hypothetical protein
LNNALRFGETIARHATLLTITTPSGRPCGIVIPNMQATPSISEARQRSLQALRCDWHLIRQATERYVPSQATKLLTARIAYDLPPLPATGSAAKFIRSPRRRAAAKEGSGAVGAWNELRPSKEI